MGLKIIFCEPVEPPRRRLWLRTYVSSRDLKCTGKYGYHNAMKFLRDEGFRWEGSGRDKVMPLPSLGVDDFPPSAFPTTCEGCGCDMGLLKINCQVFQDRLFRRADTGESFARRDLPPGAVWYDEFDGRYFGATEMGPGPDGRWLNAKLPNGSEWHIDSRASNCTMPDDAKHHCWVRHGDPRAGTLHVDKNGPTCAAGAGSIQSGNYHGFLHNGEFT